MRKIIITSIAVIILSVMGYFGYKTNHPVVEQRLGAGAGNYYWVRGTGNWSDATNHWATSSGGAPSASNLPGAGDNCFFDSNSSSTAYTVTADATLNCNNVDITGPASGNLTLSGAQLLKIYGNLSVNATTTSWTYNGTFDFVATSGIKTITTNNNILSAAIRFSGVGGTFQLSDNINISNAANNAISYLGGTFDANGKTVTLSGSASCASGDFTGANSFYNLTKTITAVKTGNCSLNNSINVTNLLTINGDSPINRVLILSGTVGTAKTITAASTSISNVDFKDITASGTANWDLSNVSGYSGDCGRNTGITFTTATTSYWKHGGTASVAWSTSNWYTTSGGSTANRVPLCQDTAIFDENSFTATGKTVTIDMTRIGSTSMANVINNPTIAPSTALSFFGSLILGANSTLAASTQIYTYEGISTSTLVSAGKTWAKNFWINPVVGSLVIADTFNSAGDMLLLSGNTTISNDSLTVKAFSCSGSYNMSLNMGNGTINITAGAVDLFSLNCANLTITPEASLIKLNGVLTADRSVTLGNKILNNIWNNTTGNFGVKLSTNPTFGDFKITGGRITRFIQNSTTTVSSFTIISSSTATTTINSNGNGTHNLVKTGGGIVSGDYLYIASSSASPVNTWYAGTHSIDGGNNSGWIFTDPPAGSSTPSTNYIINFE